MADYVPTITTRPSMVVMFDAVLWCPRPASPEVLNSLGRSWMCFDSVQTSPDGILSVRRSPSPPTHSRLAFWRSARSVTLHKNSPCAATQPCGSVGRNGPSPAAGAGAAAGRPLGWPGRMCVAAPLVLIVPCRRRAAAARTCRGSRRADRAVTVPCVSRRPARARRRPPSDPSRAGP